MAYLAVSLIIAFAAAYGCLRLACARARERAGLPARARVKLPLSWWVVSILLLFINAAFLFSHSHRAPSVAAAYPQPGEGKIWAKP